jgi:hypothetical protein
MKFHLVNNPFSQIMYDSHSFQGMECAGQRLLIKFPDNPIQNGNVVIKKGSASTSSSSNSVTIITKQKPAAPPVVVQPPPPQPPPVQQVASANSG